MTIDRVPTGVPGLDELLGGGFPKSSTILVTGTPGSAKTIFTMQYILNGALKYGDKGIFITVEQTFEQLSRQFLEFGFDIEKMQNGGQIAIICLEVKPELGEDFLEMLISKKFQERIIQFGASRMVIDPLNLVLQFSADYGGERRGVQKLISAYKKLGCTTLFTHERTKEGMNYEFGVEDFIVDGIIHLQFIKASGAFNEGQIFFERRLNILKMRETNHGHGLYRFVIEKDGVHVYHDILLRSKLK